jgi:protein-disulfide isomerase
MNKITARLLISASFVGLAVLAACDTRPLEAPRPAETPSPQKPIAVKPAALFQVPLGDSPARGGATPRVTIVVFSEFQCPYCRRVAATLDQLRKTYGDDVRFVFKHRPLPFHDRAVPAALAAEAAREQGKFWEMHDQLFTSQRALGPDDLESYARAIGLDVDRWKAAMAGGAAKARLDADAALADQLAVQGTPTFFVNGRLLVGAQPFDKFKALIDDELGRADEALAHGVSRTALYGALTREGLTKAPPPKPETGDEGDNQPIRVALGNTDGITKGPADAPVTIVEFSDFQCPFCARAEATLDRVMATYPGRVRVVWRDFPLPFHDNAAAAALIGREARAEGKFWPLQKQLFANQGALDRAGLERLAVAAGLDPGRVRAALDRPARGPLDADVAEAGKLGVRGTPTFFINGRRLTGAQPFDRFKGIIDEELARTEALVAKGIPRAKLYDTLMKDARRPAGP